MNTDQIILSITTLAAVIIGGLLTLVSNYFLKKREIRLQVAQSLVNKRIDAYDELLTHVRFASILIVTECTDGDLLKYPVIFENEKDFGEWESKFTITVRRTFHLLDDETYQACFAFQNYLLNLNKLTGGLKGSSFGDRIKAELGAKLLPDFKKYAGGIEDCCYRFYQKGVYSLRISPPDLRNADKSSDQMLRELMDTQLWKLRDKLR